jgi:Glycosyltransferase Family 4
LSRLKILHINDGDLDDPRIVNSAITGKKAGYDVYFCGTNKTAPLNTDVFKDKIEIDFTREAKLAKPIVSFLNYWPWYPYPQEARRMKRQLNEVINQIRPDLIHAHNIFAGRYASSFGIPMVLDDHELYSVEVKAEYDWANNVRTRMKAKFKAELWAAFEHELGAKHPIITVSGGIADHHKQYCEDVFVVPNYPRLNEMKSINLTMATKGRVQSVYLGRDPVSNPSSFRDISQLHEIFSDREQVGSLVRIGVVGPTTPTIRSLGLLRMEDAYRIMQEQCHIGLVPWRRHWFHKYCVPNKVYEYAHCGLWLITIDDLHPVVNDFGSLCDTFETYQELSSLLEYYNTYSDELNEKRLQSLKHAQTNLIWEKVEDKILEAYRTA